MARQPIFDRGKHVVGYELLFRSSLSNVFSHHDQDQASIQMMDTTLLGFGLDSLVGKVPGYFNVTRDVLIRELYAALPKDRAVIEVLESVEPDEEVIAACRAVKRSGYRLALDDFVLRADYEPLIALADTIKVDFLATKGATRGVVAGQFIPRGIELLAEKVETHADFEEASELGYTLFQGYFFCKPEMLSGKDIPSVKSTCLRFIQELHRPELDYDRLEAVIKSEVSLSVKLLRYLNSAGFGWRHEVTTIRQALRILGERPMKKWASLVALTLLGDDKPVELVVTSMVRAQFCEQIGLAGALPGREADLFLAGLLSTLDALLDRPMEDVLSQMAVPADIRSTLLGEPTRLSQILALAIAYDRGDWVRVSTIAKSVGVAERTLPELYRESIEWVMKILDG